MIANLHKEKNEDFSVVMYTLKNLNPKSHLLLTRLLKKHDIIPVMSFPFMRGTF